MAVKTVGINEMIKEYFDYQKTSRYTLLTNMQVKRVEKFSG